MDAINAFLTRATDVVLAPAASWPPLLVLLMLAAVCGAAATWVFGRTSSQRRLAAASDRARAELLGMKLFRDDVRVVLRCQWGLLKAVGARLLLALPPLVVLAPPFAVILCQLALRYEHRPLVAGESVVVELGIVPEAWPAGREAVLEVPPGVAVETPALRDGREHAVWWRLRVESAPNEGAGPLHVRLGEERLEKSLTVAADPARLGAVSRRRAGPGFRDRLLHPGEHALPRGSIARSIIVHYPQRTTAVLGVDPPWWLTFLVAALAAGLVARPFLRVRF